MSQSVVVNHEGVNTYSQIKKRSFAYFTFQGNTNETPLSQDVWAQFVNPTGGLVSVYQSNSDFTVSPTELKITYTGTDPKWFNLSAVTNIYRASGGNQTRTLELQWKINGTFVGFSRRVQSNTEANIYTGNGMIYLQNGDELTPWVRNVENGDDTLLDNASFTLSEETVNYF